MTKVPGGSGGNGVGGMDHVGVLEGADRFRTSHRSQSDKKET